MRTFLIILATIAIILVGCKKSIIPTETSLISNENFDQPVLIEGHKYDGLIIENCTFTKKGITVNSVDNLIIRNCTFTDINGNAMEIGLNSGCQNLRIENCVFTNISENGIIAGANNNVAFIQSNTFDRIGLSEIGGALAQPSHAINWHSSNFIIEENSITNVSNDGGNGIHVTSNGLLRKNIISNCSNSGINYASENEIIGDTLLIENNMIYSCDRGVNISNEIKVNLPSYIYIGFNTLVCQDKAPFAINNGFEYVDVYAYGNLFVNKTSQNYLQMGTFVRTDSNIVASSDIGFVNYGQNNYHLTSSNPAIGKAAGLNFFPTDDIDGDGRFQWSLDCGADEF